MNQDYKIIESLKLASDVQSIASVEKLIDKVCSKIGVNKEDTNLKIDVSVLDGTHNICFSVRDEGPGFDFNNLPDPTSPDNILKENGRGIFLMKNLADKVEFTGEGNEVSLFFSK